MRGNGIIAEGLEAAVLAECRFRGGMRGSDD